MNFDAQLTMPIACFATKHVPCCFLPVRRHTPSGGVLLAIQAGARRLAASLPAASGLPPSLQAGARCFQAAKQEIVGQVGAYGGA
jgi:hypothetical protein